MKEKADMIMNLKVYLQSLGHRQTIPTLYLKLLVIILQYNILP